MKFFIITLGCKVNQYESEAMHKKMLDSGFEDSFNANDADIVIINSCTVTATSDQKVRQIIHKTRRENLNAILVLTGCMPQAFPNEYAVFKDVDIVLGNSNRYALVPSINKFILERKQIIDIKSYDNNDEFEKIEVEKFHERTRAFLKIEDGCNRFCSYCIIPYARGRVRSKELNEIKSEVLSLASNGYKEIVLVGINLSAYGSDIGLNLCDAVDTVCEVDGIERVRLGSLEPDLMDETTMNRLLNQPKFCPQFHLSLQSGCDETLKRMNRHYKTTDYLKLCEVIRKTFENASITTDIMVGFPGETEEEFNKSLAFAKEVKFAKAHVFPYSRRPGTRAAEFCKQVTNATKKLRSHKMIEATNETRKEFLRMQVSREESVLFETKASENIYEGYTRNYTPVKVKAEKDIRGMTKNVKILGVEDDYCIGELIN